MHNYKKLDTWILAMKIARSIYQLAKDFPKEENYGITSQIKRSAISIPSNIAEGAGRNNNGEFKHFLGIAAGSSYELETQLLLCQQFGFADKQEVDPVFFDIEILQKKLYKLIKSLE